MVAARLLHVLGYNTPDVRLVHLRRDDLTIIDGAPVRDAFGRRRVMKRADLDVLLSKAARGADGRYRALASRAVDGTDLGPFRYAGTRRDDPNDIFPHEHRRELRGLRVFSAWLNHDDAHAIDTRDVLVQDGSRRLVRHYLVDFASTLGSGTTRAGRPDVANPYAWARRSQLLTTLTFGFHVRPWTGVVAYPDLPSVGRYEGAVFEPETWKPPYRNGAFENARPDDTFWAARRVMAVSDVAIRAAVTAGQYSDARAEAYLAQALIARRDKIGRLWLNGLLPLVECHLAAEGTLTCSNVAVERNVAEPGGEYRIRWYRFDNETDSAQPVGEEAVTREARFIAPRDVLDRNEYVMAEIRGAHPRHPGWATPMKVYFRRTAGGWLTVGVERLGAGLYARQERVVIGTESIVEAPGRHGPAVRRLREQVIEAEEAPEGLAPVSGGRVGQSRRECPIGRIGIAEPRVEVAADDERVERAERVEETARLTDPCAGRQNPEVPRGCRALEVHARDPQRPRAAVRSRR